MLDFYFFYSLDDYMKLNKRYAIATKKKIVADINKYWELCMNIMINYFNYSIWI